MRSDPPIVRRLRPEDAEAARRLGMEAFGMPPAPLTSPATLDWPGRTYHGAFDGDRLVGRLIDQAYDSWFGGLPVPTSGIAGVTVAMEDRGRGVLRRLLASALAAARERGAVISGLFPSATGVYRRLGYELVGDGKTVGVATSELATLPPAVDAATRRAGAADLPGIRTVYDTWAAAQNGPLTRRGASFPATDAEVLAGFDAITVAEDREGRIVGYASWDRGHDHDQRGTLAVSDLLALSADGYQALLHALGSYAAVAPTTKIDTSGDDVARLFLPGRRWDTVTGYPYMLAVIDVPGAFSRRGYPRFGSARLAFRVAGDPVAAIDGAYQLEVAEGVGGCHPAEHRDDRTFHPRGLALAYAGAQSCANLRWAGLLTGGRPEDDPVWDTLLGGRQFHIRDLY